MTIRQGIKTSSPSLTTFLPAKINPPQIRNTTPLHPLPMAIRTYQTLLKKPTFQLSPTPLPFQSHHHPKTTCAQYIASRPRDPTFEKLMEDYKNLLKVISIQDLILSSPHLSIPLHFLSRLSQKLHLNRGAPSFIRKYPHIFTLFYNPSKSQPFIKLTQTATLISTQESAAADSSKSAAVHRLVRLLSMSAAKSLPLRAIFKVWRELGLPDDFEDSVISQNPNIFSLSDAHEPNTHLLKLVPKCPNYNFVFVPVVENWRGKQCDGDFMGEDSEIRFSFKQGYPPGMRLSKDFRVRVKEWQRLAYLGPYEEIGEGRRNKGGKKAVEKRAVGIVHEFLSLTVEKMVEVEKISHFRKWFGIDLNIRDLFLDHPGIFYLSTKGKRHTVFLREAYERGCLIEPNPIYDARRRLLDLVILGRRNGAVGNLQLGGIGGRDGDELQEEDED
ncbi:ubiquitin carboxyl-terminal hydrolase family protein [Tasmannia lanceolata]|uniref:ubiquitin carboxyl-terminal hydrolase family protein n=1 Tax=Tasmannia lanceolata TaxID=3420 RepID=UPI004062EBA6